MNRITITGKLTKDPEFQQHGNVNIVRFSMHHSRNGGKDQSGQINWITEFFDLELKGFPNSKNSQGRTDTATAFMQRGLKKGDMLWVEASQETREYKDNQGQDKKFKSFVVENYEVLQAKPQQNNQQSYQQQQPQPGYQQPQQPQYQAPAQPQYVPQPPQGFAPPPVQQPQYAPPAQPQYAPPAPPPQPQYQQPQPPAFRPPAPAPAPAPQQPGQPAPPPQFNGGQTAPF